MWLGADAGSPIVWARMCMSTATVGRLLGGRIEGQPVLGPAGRRATKPSPKTGVGVRGRKDRPGLNRREAERARCCSGGDPADAVPRIGHSLCVPET
jgi:hypothetical protein